MPTSTIRPPRAEAAKASATVRVTPTASTTKVAGPPNAAATASGQVTRRRVDHLARRARRTARAGTGSPRRRARLLDAEPPGGQQARLPDRAAADDQHPVLRRVAPPRRTAWYPTASGSTSAPSSAGISSGRVTMFAAGTATRSANAAEISGATPSTTLRLHHCCWPLGAGRAVVAAHHRVDGDQLAGARARSRPNPARRSGRPSRDPSPGPGWRRPFSPE